MKSLYRHRRSGDIFAIETNEAGQVISTSGPLFGDDFDLPTASNLADTLGLELVEKPKKTGKRS